MAYLDRTDSAMASLDLPEVYRVGGSVRDELIGRRPRDADYMIRNVSLDELGSVLLRRVPNVKSVKPLKLRDGRQFGWRFAAPGLGMIEVALPRTEVSTGPHRRDFQIVVDPTLPLHEDAKRRDFTFNALYKSVAEGNLVVDPTNTGLYDLQHKLVRTTHPDSFRDDPLRTLRALRFVSTLGYDLATETHEQMNDHADAVTGLTDKGVSGTALDELCKLLMGEDVAKALELAASTGVLQVLLPELADMIGFEQGSKYHDLTADAHTFKALNTAAHVDAPLRVRMALLFHDAGKPESAWVGLDGRTHYYEPSDDAWYDVSLADGTIHQSDTKAPDKPRNHEDVSADLWLAAAARLNAPRDLRRDVETIIRNHMVTVTGRIKPVKVRRGRVKYGDALLRDLFMHRMCDISGKTTKTKEHIAHIVKMEAIRSAAQEEGVPASVKELEIDGKDVMTLDIRGESIGQVLRAVLDEVVCDPTPQKKSREWQLERAKALA